MADGICENCGRETERLYDDGGCCAVCRHYYLSASEEGTATCQRMLHAFIGNLVQHEGVSLDDIVQTVDEVIKTLRRLGLGGNDHFREISAQRQDLGTVLCAEVA